MSPEMGESLALQLTQSGMAALAAVRISGPDAAAFVSQHFDRPAMPGRCVHGRWRDSAGEVLDDVLVARDEQGFDINLHGGRRIVIKLLEQAASAGFRVVMGEAAIDAAAAGDVEAWVPRASTELGLRMLLAQPAAWAALDPQTADIPAMIADQTLRRMLVPATVAVVGEPNVGKSTLTNALFGQERSIVADIPGTTRDWVGGLADLGGLPVLLLDTPGRRDTADAVEREAIELSRRPVEAADLVIHLLDATRKGEAPAESLVVANKCDLAPPPAGVLGISAKTGHGLPELMGEIHRRLGVDVPGPHGVAMARWWLTADQTLLRKQGRRAVATISRRLQYR